MHQRLTLVSLDIQNAFNSVPFNAIENTLQRLLLPKNVTDYILTMLQKRYSSKTGQLKCGVAQGDPLSMYIFCATIDPILQQLIELGCEVLAYADDILLGIPSNKLSGDIISKAEEFFSEVGLIINKQKCKSTENEAVEFVGYKFP